MRIFGIKSSDERQVTSDKQKQVFNLSLATCHLPLLFTQFAQEAEAVDAGLMAVAPAKVERVAPDELHVLNRERIGDCFRSQHALARHLVDALRARTDAPERRRTIVTHAPVA